MNQSYEGLMLSVYQSLVLETRLKPYLDAVLVEISADGIRLDYSGMMAQLTALQAVDPKNALIDALELDAYVDMRWLGGDCPLMPMIADFINNPAYAEVVSAVALELGTQKSGFSNGTDRMDFLFGTNGTNDTIYGNNGNDYLFGLDGDDTLRGGAGNNRLVPCAACHA